MNTKIDDKLLRDLLQNYRLFLNSSWSEIVFMMEQMDWDDDIHHYDDWLQANWELLVERVLMPKGGILWPYGSGYNNGGRYSQAVGDPTHKIGCSDDGFSTNEFVFGCFVMADEVGFAQKPPFDVVCAYDDASHKVVYLPFEELAFCLKGIR